MSLKTTAIAGALALLPTLALGQIAIEDPYARAASPMSPSGAAFMQIVNTGETDDRLVAAISDVSERVELHTHIRDGDIMRMVEIEDGIEIPAGQTVSLERGGMHVMFLGIQRPLNGGDELDLTLVFENAGEIEVTVPVDNDRMPARMMEHGGHGHGAQTDG